MPPHRSPIRRPPSARGARPSGRSSLGWAALGILLGGVAGCVPQLGNDGDDDAADDDAGDDDAGGDDDTGTPADDDDLVGDDDTTGDDDDRPVDCTAAPLDATFFLCPDDFEGFPWGERLYGTWNSWADGAAAFTDLSGAVWTFSLGWSGGAAEGVDPSTWPLVSFVLDGQCGRGAWQVFQFFAPDDEDALIGAYGNTLPAALPGVEVRAEAGPCVAEVQTWCSCAELCRVDQIVFDTGTGLAWTAPQGSVVDDGALHFAAWVAHTRENLFCADIPTSPAVWGVWVDVPPPR